MLSLCLLYVFLCRFLSLFVYFVHIDSKENIPIHTIGNGPQHEFSYWGHRTDAYVPEVPHRHDYYEFLLFFEGGGTHAIDFVNHPIDAASVHFIKAGQVHIINRANTSSGCNFRFMRSYFYGDETGAAAFFREYPFFSVQSPLPVLDLPPEVFAALRNLVAVYAESRKFASPKASRALIRAMLQLIKGPFEQTTSLPPAPGPLQRFMMLVAQHFNETRQVADYADMLHITPNYLNELCSQKLGTTAKALIEEQVWLEAKRMLFHTDLSVKEIAHGLNFDDPSYFVRRFKSKTGFTPLRFRKGSRR